MTHTRPATLSDFGLAANSQLVVRSISLDDIKVSFRFFLLLSLPFYSISLILICAKVFIQVSIPAQKISKFFPFLIDPGITVVELKYHLAEANPSLSNLYPLFSLSCISSFLSLRYSL